MRKKPNPTVFTIFIIISIVAGVSVLSGCNQQPTTPGLNTVTIDNLAFNPNTLTISNGTTITWKNNENVGHNVVADNGLFSSGILSKGQNFSYTFTSSGTYNYSCSIHPSMRGKIIVQ